MDARTGQTASISLPEMVTAAPAELPPASDDLPRQQEAYWAETLAGIPELLELSADRPRPAQPDPTVGVVALELDEAAAAGLHALASRHGAALSTALLAGWAVVLGRLSGQTDVVIGTAAADGERGIGVPENPLPVRVDLSGSPTAAELLARVDARVRGALRNQALPYQRMAELAQPNGAAASGDLRVARRGREHAGASQPGVFGGTLRSHIRPVARASRGGRPDRRRGGVRDLALRPRDGGALGGLPVPRRPGDGGG
jgi:hypothetical protein